MELSGKLLQLLPLQTGQGKNGTWKKQDFVLEMGGQYPKKVCISAWGDKIDMSSFRIGEQIDVSFDVESREYNGKWYTDVKAWKVVSGKPGSDGSGGVNRNTTDPIPVGQSADDDLPF